MCGSRKAGSPVLSLFAEHETQVNCRPSEAISLCEPGIAQPGLECPPTLQRRSLYPAQSELAIHDADLSSGETSSPILISVPMRDLFILRRYDAVHPAGSSPLK